MQITVRLHGVLSRFADGQRHVVLEVADQSTVDEVLTELAIRYPGVGRRVRDETGTVRRHINLFVDGTQLRELGGVAHRPPPQAEILILPAVSGGCYPPAPRHPETSAWGLECRRSVPTGSTT